MLARTVLTVRSDHPKWAVLRSALASLPDVSLVGEATTVDEARAAAARSRPEMIISDVRVEGISAIPLLTDLRIMLPDALIAVFADRYVEEDVIWLAPLGITGYLLWDDLDEPGLASSANILRSGCLVAANQEAMIILLEGMDPFGE